MSTRKLNNQKKAYAFIGVCLILFSIFIIIVTIRSISSNEDFLWAEFLKPGLVLFAGIASLLQARKISKEISDRGTE